MGLQVTVSVQQQTDVVFSDIAALNAALEQSNFGEFFSDNPQKPSKFIEIASSSQPYLGFNAGDIVFHTHEGDGPYSTVEVWGLFDLDTVKLIADHLVEGRIVFRIDIEGHSPEWYVAEPGKAYETKPSF